MVSLIKPLWQPLSCILPCLSLFEKQSHKKCNDLLLRLQNTVYLVWDCNKSVWWKGWKDVCRLARERQCSLVEPTQNNNIVLTDNGRHCFTGGTSVKCVLKKQSKLLIQRITTKWDLNMLRSISLKPQMFLIVLDVFFIIWKNLFKKRFSLILHCSNFTWRRK